MQHLDLYLDTDKYLFPVLLIKYAWLDFYGNNDKLQNFSDWSAFSLSLQQN